MQRKKKSSSAACVLKGLVNEVLEEVFSYASEIDDGVRHTGLYLRGGSELVRHVEYSIERAAEYEAVRRLQKKRALEIHRLGQSVRLRLSNDAVLRGLAERIRSAPTLLEGRAYLLSFDIPERSRKTRDMVRDYLKRCGLEKRHASLWVCRKAAERELHAACRILNAGKWLHLYDARLVHGDST